MDNTHDGIHRQGDTIKLHSPCGIHREFHNVKQLTLFNRLHKKNCEECNLLNGGMAIIPQQYTTLENKKSNKKIKAMNENYNVKKMNKNKILKNAERLLPLNESTGSNIHLGQ